MEKEVHAQKSFLTTWLLSLLVGIFGVDRFYLGKIGTGILKLITLGGLGVWVFIDVIIILCNGQRDKDGRKLEGYGKNKNLAIIVTVVLFGLSAVVGAINSSKTPTQTSSSPLASMATTASPSPAAWDVNAAYAKIQTGMTKAQVEEATGKKSENCTESQNDYTGKSEFCTYGNAFIDKGTISVTYMNDKVSDKTKSTY